MLLSLSNKFEAEVLLINMLLSLCTAPFLYRGVCRASFSVVRTGDFQREKRALPECADADHSCSSTAGSIISTRTTY